MRTLTLTSPRFLEGADVLEAQRKLIAGGFLRRGGDDGVYGPESSRAAADAHWFLGFAGKLQRSPNYGPVLDRLLTLRLAGDPLPAAYQTRANQRRIEAAPLGSNALRWLQGHVGETESPPGSNRVAWASLWYGVIGPWCAMAVTRAFVEAGSKAFERGVRYAYVPYIVADARRGLNWLSVTTEPRSGDLVCYDWQGNGVYDHVGIVNSPPGSLEPGSSFTTVEGNTSFDDSGSQSNGGACAARSRQVLAGGRTLFIRVNR